MTNEKAIEQLRTILKTERSWKEYYGAPARLPDKVRREQFKKQSLRVAALEHAITMLGMLELNGVGATEVAWNIQKYGHPSGMKP